MNQPKGIGGILDQIVGADERRPRDQSQPAPPPSPIVQPRDEGNVARPELQERIRAKRGRPFGKPRSSGPREARTKVTFWIAQALIDEYRDWSWEARCSLSELVHQAMHDYRRRFRRLPGT